jgi:hypothetical protein
MLVTATIVAMPTAMPRAESTARSRRVRRPTVPRDEHVERREADRPDVGHRRLSADDAAVAHLHAARQSGGDLPVVGDDRDGGAVAVQAYEQVEHGPPVAVSRAPVGSSASSSAGSWTIARAMATRWRSPPESSWAGA